MLAAGSSETACEPTGGVPIARPDRSGGGHELAQHNRHLGGAAAGALKANFAACQPRSPGENETTLPRWYPDLPARTSRQYSSRFGESLRTHIHRAEKYPLTHKWGRFAGPLNEGCSRRRFRDSCERRSGLESSYAPGQARSTREIIGKCKSFAQRSNRSQGGIAGIRRL
jgi:hypothetical protein